MRARIYKVPDGLSLKNVELAIKHGSPCELSGCCLPRAGSNQRSHYRIRDEIPAVRGEFNRVITGERTWTWKQRHQRLIELLVAIENVTEVGNPWLVWPDA